jgi:hypothetical protein
MTIQTPIVAATDAQPRSDLLIEAVRCWRLADGGATRCQRLHGVLADRECGMLAPVFDSLFALYETALARPIAVGDASPSADEVRLSTWLSGPTPLAEPSSSGAPETVSLQCAVRSTRAMMSLADGDPGRAIRNRSGSP